MSLPAVLHRYFHRDAGMAFLADQKLRLDPPSRFNDPFEFLPGSEFNLPLEFIAKSGGGVLQNIAKVVTLPSVLALRMLVGGSLKELVPNFRENSAMAFRKRLDDFFRIACFCEADDNLLLWAHYARSHTGLLVSFRTSMDYWGNDLHPVAYSDERIQIPFTFSTDPNAPLVDTDWQRQLLVTKSSCWSYEREWRCIKRTTDCCADADGWFLPVPHACVTKIIYGCRFFDGLSKPEQIKSVCIKIKEYWPNATQCVMQPHETSFALTQHKLLLE